MRLVVAFVLSILGTFASAETLITKAKIAEVNERGFVLTVGTEAVAVNDESTTRFWKGKAPADRQKFAKDETVVVRIKTDASPALVREMSDEGTADWLNRIRKEVLPCTVQKVDPKQVLVKFDDGTAFTYRYSAKSKATLKGAEVPITDLKEGQKLYVKARLMPNLDTWFSEGSDSAPAPKAASTQDGAKKTPKAKPLKIGATGTLKGEVDLHRYQWSLIDIYVEQRLIHITYNSATKFLFNGEKADASAVQRGRRITVTYRRDQFGRLIASKVELFEG